MIEIMIAITERMKEFQVNMRLRQVLFKTNLPLFVIS